MSDRVLSLSYAVRPKVVLRYLAQIGLGLALLSAPPLVVSLLAGEYSFSLRFGVIIVLLVGAGLPALRLPEPPQVQRNEAMTFVALAFLITPLLMSWPLAAAGLAPVDALFEAVSAVTTTGLTTVGSVQDKPLTFVFARAWMQWYSGLGFVVLSVALLMGHQAVSKRLVEEQVGKGLATTARIYARRMLLVYVSLTALGFLLVWGLSGRPFAALMHTLTAVSTAGFSSYDDSLAGFPGWAARLSVIGISLAGAVPLFLYYRFARREWRSVLRDSELRGLLAFCLATCALLFAFMLANGHVPWPQTLRHALLIGISAQSTTGFTSLPLAELDAASKLVLVAAMCTGGGLGSTAGGIKVLRLLVVLRLLQVVIQRSALSSHAVLVPRLGGNTVEPDDVVRALVLVVLFFALVFVSWLGFAANGYASIDALFEVSSAAGTVGLSSGITRPGLAPGLKLLLCGDMLLGRLEITALLILFYSRTWFGKRVRT